jgi:hypothetical protein
MMGAPSGLAAEDRLREVAARIRIRTIVEFEWDGRTVQVPPPLPRRFPALPMIDRLQAELYAGAYHARLDGGGFGGEAPQPGAPVDMFAALSAANASRTRVDPDWLVLEIDPSGATTVAKRGATRRIPPTEIAAPGVATPGQQGMPPAPGQLVPIILPREVPEQGGFYFAHGESADSTLEGRPALRFYWNIPAEAAPELMHALSTTLNARGVPFAFKCPRSAAVYRRFDSGTLFVAKPWFAATLAALPEIHDAVAERLRPDVPLFARSLRAGLGFAEDPGAGESFGMARCRLLAEGLWTGFVRGASDPSAILDEVRAHFLLNGIDLDRAYLNPWSVDRYDYGAFA